MRFAEAASSSSCLPEHVGRSRGSSTRLVASITTPSSLSICALATGCISVIGRSSRRAIEERIWPGSIRSSSMAAVQRLSRLSQATTTSRSKGRSGPCSSARSSAPSLWACWEQGVENTTFPLEVRSARLLPDPDRTHHATLIASVSEAIRVA